MARTPLRVICLLSVVAAALNCNSSGDGLGSHADPGPDPGDTGGNAPGDGAVAGGGSGGPCRSGDIPAAVRSVLAMRCQLCHSNPPVPTVPASLMTLADFS